MNLYELQACAISELNVDPSSSRGNCSICGVALTPKVKSARCYDKCVECYLETVTPNTPE